ncbi:WD repeat-containing protein 43 isoform X2 [Periophthalmus magnuspinnatus]|uniref:WD repeat-containing protein 43 isoform X2 n=1 Tax=Periophthalmus magnuspinnatus TaxID=409849 RepID=UPI002436FBFE|nr:WD repeat-containing protein 43 isoform X2 [Periophthalmus magnuspinnatus]
MASDGGSSSLQLPCVFSPKSRQYLALCAQDGRLRIWNTDNKTLHQEYVPSAHLSATCTCISWGPCRTVKEGPQRKKRKSEAVQVEERADLLAMGTAAGTVLIYSTVKGKLHCTLDGGHTGGVNCVQWHPEDSLIYSGSDDTNITEWDLQSGKTRSVWKADRAAITSLCVSPDGKLLLSAGYVIKMWDLETKEIYRKFTGHSTAVTTLCFATTRPPDGNGLYFLSGAAHDRLLSVWQVRDDGKDKNSVVSFTLTDEPQHVSLVPSNSKEEAVRLAVVCKDGQLHLFEHFLNGPCKKPLSPSCTVQLSDTKDSPAPIPLLAAALGAESRAVTLAYGNHLQPVMERVELNTSERHICLTRDVHTSLSLSMDTNVSKVKTPVVNAKSKVLVPGLPGHQAPKVASQGSEKRKKDIDTKEMSIAERLGEIDLVTVSSEKGAPKNAVSLQTDNFAVLLVQGLESNDPNILNKVFQNRKEFIIKKTVARIPLSAVLPLVQQITTRLQGHPISARLMVLWLKAVLMHHTSYLASLPDLVTQLGVLYHVIENRVKLFHKLTKLHGKLYLLTAQMATNTNISSVTDVDHAAKLVYEEESSEDEASGDEALPDEESDVSQEEDEMMVEEEDPNSRRESKTNGEEMDPENESEEE